MSASPQRGRRRAENARRPSLFAFAAAGKGTRAAGKSTVTTTAKYMAAVAVVGALVAAGAVTQSVEHTANAQSGANLLAAVGHASAPAVSAPLNVPITFAGADIGSLPSAAPTSAATQAAAAKAQSSDVTPIPAPAPAPAPAPVVVDDPTGAQAYAAGELATRGWGADQMSCLTQLWNRESDWLTSAENPDGGAYGIAQSLPAEKMASVGSDWKTNYRTQIIWGLGYIQERYGSPCAAWGHSNAVNWY